MTDDHDIRDALARAHEPAPPFDSVARQRPRASRAGVLVAAASVAVAIAVYVAWPSSGGLAVIDAPATPATLDLTAPGLASTSIATPLDSLLAVPELAVLETTPTLVTGGLP